MGYMLPHVLKDQKTGRLSYRRKYPPELLKFINDGVELKRSLKDNWHSDRAIALYNAAARDWQRAVDFAAKAAADAYHRLTPQLIADLAEAWKNEHLGLDEEVRWLPRPVDRKIAARNQMLGDLEADLKEAKALRGLGDLDGLTALWGDSAEQFAQVHGVRLDRTASSFTEYVRAFHDANIEVWEALERRAHGEHVATPAMPTLYPTGSPAIPSPSNTTSFEAIAQGILESPRHPIGVSTKQMSATALRFFREAFGSPVPSAISKAMVSEWLDLLAKRPQKLPAVRRLTPIRDLAALYEGEGEVKRLAPKTMASLLGAMSALWNKGKEEGRIPETLANPFAGRASLASHRPEEPQELSLTELQAMFALPIFTRHERPKRGRGEASYWLPLLLLWTGARPEELAQLMTTDVFQDPDDPQGRWLLRITDQGVHPIKGRRSLKTTKTESGRRTFPIHPELLRLNFLAFVDHVRTTGQTALFPALTTKGERGLLFAGWGEWWSLHVREKGILPEGNGRRPSREFRHNWNTAARRCQIPQDAREYLLGHVRTGGSANELYGGKGALGDYVDQLVFRGLDISGVLPWKLRTTGE